MATLQIELAITIFIREFQGSWIILRALQEVVSDCSQAQVSME